MNTSDGIDPARAWLAAFVTAFVAVVGAAIAFPQRVYDGFLWRYFFGPVDADAHGATCAVRSGGTTERLYSQTACASADGIVVTPGYTTVSTISYALVLIFMLVGVYFLLDRLDVEMSPRFYFALFPFMLLGGALRVVEDVNATFVREDLPMLIPYPEVSVIISPFIYFVMFAITLTALIVGIVLDNRGVIDEYEPFLGGVGALTLAVTVGFLLYISATSEVVGFYPTVSIITLVGATAIAALFWWASNEYAPYINDGTGLMGALVVWGHSVDGIANVLSLDWANALGLPVTYGSKHVINAATVRITSTVQPAWLSDSIGTAWPFLLLKVAAAVAVVWVFDEQIFEESPTYAYILFIAILAVGLGPGTRDMLRATLGI
ncbi:DUF63 family protein [Natronomonas halophila]|uniref:DUF63 family protein n=1 Tax=Natronomonas halophila TaxID=2747817 RepID=UPI0015B76AB2|nr:DUF63 family protein [Natronomonas halophila]QLD84287.1 DUF63 family protein [Natronomonas halophila]